MDERALPVVAAAMPVVLLTEYRDWLCEGQRDIELQDPISPEVLDGDWRALARRANSLLDGHTETRLRASDGTPVRSEVSNLAVDRRSRSAETLSSGPSATPNRLRRSRDPNSVTAVSQPRSLLRIRSHPDPD
jgi:hypothetical protein